MIKLINKTRYNFKLKGNFMTKYDCLSNYSDFIGNKITCSVIALLYITSLHATDNVVKYQIEQIVVDANLTKTKSSLVTNSDNFQGIKTINRAMIESMPSGNGDFVQLLRTNPNVQFSNTNRQSTTMGEIDPANISINGSKYWQNSFIIDGVNINNDLDPARNPGGNPGRYSAFDTSLNSVSQGMAIDSDFIESIDVYDSDVSAKYGSFTGGVVSAKTRNPRAGFHGKFSVQHTQDEWTKFHLYGNNEEEFLNSSDLQNQPKFDKWKTSLNLEGFLTQDLGVMFGYTNTRSKIPLQAYDSRFEGEKELKRRVQRRNIDNYFLKALWYATDRLTLTPSITYAPSSSKVFNDHVKNSYSEMKSGGLNLALKADYDLDFMEINQVLAYNQLETSRDAEHEYFKEWKFSNVKNWGWKLLGSLEGGYGDIGHTQNTISYNADFKFNEVELWGIEHKFLAGLELKKQKAKFDVKNEFMTAGSAQPLSAGVVSCDPNDELCSIDDSYDRFGRNGQYLTSKTYYKGSTNVDMLSYAFFLEDEMKLGNLTLRPGVRFGGDDYMKRKTIAPRFSSSYDIFGDASSIISFGANRYYGRNIFAYKLRDGREKLTTTYTRSRTIYDQNWIKSKEPTSLTKFTELKIPYDDELSFGIKQKFGNFEFGAKYINRKGKDQIIKSTRDKLGLPIVPGYGGDSANPRNTNYQTFTNDGRSESKILTFSLRSIEDFNIWGTKNGFELNFEHLKTKSNNTLYDITLDKDILKDQKLVQYDGRVISYYDLPAQNYARPWMASLNIITKIPNYGLSVNNFFSYKGKQDAIVKTASANPRRGRPYDIYERVDLGNSYTWDARIGYAKKLPKNIEIFTNLDIYNVLNKKNKAKTLKENLSNLVYDSGRQFWLEAGIRW